MARSCRAWSDQPQMWWFSNGHAVRQPAGAPRAGSGHESAPYLLMPTSRRGRRDARDRGRAGPRTILPAVSRCRDDPVLRHGQSFFARDLVACEEAPDRAEAEDEPLLAQTAAQFLDSDVRCFIEQREDGRLMCVDPMRLAVPTQSLRPRIALHALAGPPAAYARRAHPEPLGGLPAGNAARNGGKHTFAKVHRKRFHHACRPPVPASSLNHSKTGLGIPHDSIRSATALTIS